MRSKCPKCGAGVELPRIDLASPFRCPDCDQELRIPGWYWQTLSWASGIVALAVAYALGYRGVRLVMAMLVALVPVIPIVVNLGVRLVSRPTLRACDPDYVRLDFLHRGPKGGHSAKQE